VRAKLEGCVGSGSEGRPARSVGRSARLKNGADKWTRGVGERKEKAGVGWAGRRKWASGDWAKGKKSWAGFEREEERSFEMWFKSFQIKFEFQTHTKECNDLNAQILFELNN